MTSLSCVSPPAARLAVLPCQLRRKHRYPSLKRFATRDKDNSAIFADNVRRYRKWWPSVGFEPNQGQQGLSLSLLPFSLSSTRPFSGCTLSWLSLHMALQLGSPSITRSSWSSWALNGNCYIPFGMSGAIIRPAMFLSPYDRRQTGQRPPRYFGPEMVAIKGFEPILSSF